MTFKMKGFPQHNTSAFKQQTHKYNIEGENIKIKTKTPDQDQTLIDAYNKFQTANQIYNKFASDERFGKDLNQEEMAQLQKEIALANETYNNAKTDFFNVTDSLSNVLNKKGPFPQLFGPRKKGIIRKIKDWFGNRRYRKNFRKDVKGFAGGKWKKRR